MTTAPLLSLEHISKSFGGVHALKDVSISFIPGEVHAIVGENGAGKSTLMKVIAGALQPDSGTVNFEAKPVQINGPRDASRLGVAIVYQEPVFFGELTVLENFYLGEELTARVGTLRWGAMAEETAHALQRMGLPIDLLTKTMNELSLGTQQLVLIARGIHKRARLLILDEPTSILSQAETDILFRTINELRSAGVAIAYISHRIAEIFKIADTISVLRDGALVERFPVGEATEERMITAMSGRTISSDVYRPRSLEGRAPLLTVDKLSRKGDYDDVSFSIRPGEVLGLYGLVGAGRSEMARAIFGELQPDSGTLIYDGKPLTPRSSADGFRNGIVYVPEDRRQQGLFPIRAIRDNLTAGLQKLVGGRVGSIRFGKELDIARKQAADLNVKANTVLDVVSGLSGGNQQKVVLGRGLLHQPRLLILDEPTRGIDIGTKSEIHSLIMSLAEQGIAVLVISSDLPEVLAIADRILVMYEGHILGSLSRDEATEEAILRIALGLNTAQPQYQTPS
jgi:ABC-type sugar transport system ATPase subunit